MWTWSRSGLKAAIALLDRTREVARPIDAPLVLAHEVSTLQLVGEQEVARLLELVLGEVTLEEERRVARLVLGAGEPP